MRLYPFNVASTSLVLCLSEKDYLSTLPTELLLEIIKHLTSLEPAIILATHEWDRAPTDHEPNNLETAYLSKLLCKIAFQIICSRRWFEILAAFGFTLEFMTTVSFRKSSQLSADSRTHSDATNQERLLPGQKDGRFSVKILTERIQ